MKNDEFGGPALWVIDEEVQSSISGNTNLGDALFLIVLTLGVLGCEPVVKLLSFDYL